ncbi:MAG: nucleotidyltransferase domain-containing protein [Candidatus Nanohaloarchaea archaeon]
MKEEKILDIVLGAVDEAGIDREAVSFVYLFGSYVEHPESANDIDVCVSLDLDGKEELEYKLKGRVPEKIDISVFENLPLQVRNQVFSGELLYARDDSVYDAAFETFRDFQSFEPLYKKAVGVESAEG